MKNEKIARMLKYYRLQKKYSVKDVSDLLEKADIPVATKTIYGWESGRTQPDADTLFYLCKLYDIEDILSTFGYENDDEPLHATEFEKKLIRAYRNHPEVQTAINRLLGLE